MTYFLHLVVTFEIFAIVAIGLNVLVGKAGLLSLATAGYFAVGAYTYGLLALVIPASAASTLLALLASSVAVLLLSALLWLPSLRLRGDFYVLATLAVQVCLYSALQNWYSANSPVGSLHNLTNGPFGLSGIPGMVAGARGLERNVISVTIVSSIFFACVWVAHRIDSSLWGRTVECVRDDELVVRSLGKPVRLIKFETAAIACVFSGLGGALYAAHVGFIDPSSASLEESILLLSMVLIGGTGQIRGPLAGALLLVLLPELLRLIGFPSSIAANIRVAAYGILLVLVAHFRPNGLLEGRT